MKYITILFLLVPTLVHGQVITDAEWYVRDYYRDTPILAEVARCESQFHQFDEKGRVLRGMINKSDLGVMQVNAYYHENDAYKAGLDLHLIEDNLKYGKLLYEKYGLSPWKASRGCWSRV